MREFRRFLRIVLNYLIKKGAVMKKFVWFLSVVTFMFWMPSFVFGQNDVLQMQQTNIEGIIAEVIECKRKKGILSIKVKFTNKSDDEVSLYLGTGSSYKEFYLTAENKKYFILEDAEGEALAPANINTRLKKGKSHYWWAKFPAPPAEVKEINIIIPKVFPFEDVGITDK